MRNMQYLKIVIYGPLECKNILFRVFEASIYYAYDKKEKKLYVKTSTGNYEISLDDYYAKEEARKLAERQAQLRHFVPNKCKKCKVQQVQSLMSEYRFHLQKYKMGNRYSCPQCGRKRCFARYIDEEGQIVFPDNVGRYISTVFGKEETERLFALYKVGTSKK